MAAEKKTENLKWKISDILGFEVYDQGGNSLGVLSEVISTGNNDVWSIKSFDKEILIPALKTVVSKVSITAKKIFVCLPEGYDNVYENESEPEETAEYTECSGLIVYED